MQRTSSGSLWLFRLFGIDVYVHWTWFLVALLQISSRQETYKAPHWKVIEYLCLFGFVLMHEFGHALACRSVGGKAETIILWPLGGIAFVQPPERAGAVLWSILAGPLVNLVLILPLAGLMLLMPPDTDLWRFVGMLMLMNIVLFAFNMLPVYPLDGGQALHALLWFGMGRWRSLQVVSVIGVVFGVGVFFLVLFAAAARILPAGGALMLAVICLFISLVSANSFRIAQHVQHMQNLPKHTECACPRCLTAPPRGNFWVCEEDSCHARFDTFDTRGKCPACGAWYLPTTCPHCRETNHIDRWFAYRPGVGLAEQPVQAAEDQSW